MNRLIAKLLTAVIAVSIVATCFAPLAALNSTSDKASTQEVTTQDQGLVNVLVIGAAARR